MKIKFLLCFFSIIFCCAQSPQGHAHPKYQEQSAKIWSEKVSELYQKKDWDKLKSISPLSEKFISTSIWKNKNFSTVWKAWQIEKSIQTWQRGGNGISVWKISEGKNILRPTMGIKKEQDGLWWIVFVQPQNAKNETHQGWPCSATCSITIRSNGKTKTLTARPPLHQEFNQAFVLGVPINQVSDILLNEEQKWEVEFPGQENAIFDVSFLRATCYKNFGPCGF